MDSNEIFLDDLPSSLRNRINSLTVEEKLHAAFYHWTVFDFGRMYEKEIQPFTYRLGQHECVPKEGAWPFNFSVFSTEIEEIIPKFLNKMKNEYQIGQGRFFVHELDDAPGNRWQGNPKEKKIYFVCDVRGWIVRKETFDYLNTERPLPTKEG